MATTNSTIAKKHRATSPGRSERALAEALEIPHDRYYKTYRGTRTELIAAGLALAGQFPGDPGCPSVSVHTFHRDGRTVTVRRNPSNKYRIYLTCSEKERRAERAAEDRAEEVKKVAKAVSEADEKIARLPRSAATINAESAKGSNAS
jgi:hypothetical protein